MCALAVPCSANAGVLFSGSGKSGSVTLNAAALFEVSGNTLRVTLRNTGDSTGTASGSDVPGNTLTGVFFDLPAGITLSPVSAKIAAGDLLQANKCDIGPCNNTTTNVGGEFSYATGTYSGHDGNSGISSSGYISGDSGNFNGPDLDSPGSLDGINFGIVAPVTGSNPLKPNGGLAKDPLIEGEVVFTLAISGGTLLESQISNVSFQYGTGLSEPKFKATTTVITPPVTIPEPATLLLVAPALALGIRRRMRARTAA